MTFMSEFLTILWTVVDIPIIQIVKVGTVFNVKSIFYKA